MNFSPHHAVKAYAVVSIHVDIPLINFGAVSNMLFLSEIFCTQRNKLVKFALELAMKAQRGNRDIAVLFL